MSTYAWVVIGVIVLFCVILQIPNRGREKKKEHTEILPNVSDISIRTEIRFPADSVQNLDIDTDDAAVMDLATSTAIVVQDQLGQELSFIRPDCENDLTNYREVKMAMGTNAASHALNIAMPAGQQMYTAAALAKVAPNGLFTATVEPSTLTRFLKDGTYSTMVHGPNGIVSNNGFVRIAGIGGINPVMAVGIAMQAMAAVSGQYYLNIINQRLDSIDSKLNKLLSYMTDKDIGAIAHAKQRLLEISSHETVGNNDIIEIRSMANDLGALYEGYRVRYLREKEATMNYIPTGSGTQKVISSYKKLVDDFYLTTQVCAAAYQVYLQAKLTEMAILYKIDPTASELIDLVNDAKRVYNNPFDKQLVEDPSSAFSGIITCAYKCLERKDIGEHVVGVLRTSTKKDDIRREQMAPIRNRVEALESFADTMMDLEPAKAVLNDIDRSKKMLLMPGKGSEAGRLFIAT